MTRSDPPRRAVTRRTVRRYRREGAADARDQLVTEEPLEIRILRHDCADRDAALPVSVTMRTPGHDFELAAGFLFGEGVLDHQADLAAMSFCVGAGGVQNYNAVGVTLDPGLGFDAERLRRNFYATSSCGVCGKASIEAVRDVGLPPAVEGPTVEAGTLFRMAEGLEGSQAVFARTGGLHAAALCDSEGSLLRLREDVGRHNAMDKVVGASLLAGELPLHDRLLLVSGRLSFELVQKAARAGVPVLAGVSAASSLAVELAEEVGMTLVGFLREERFNVYCGAERIRPTELESMERAT